MALSDRPFSVTSGAASVANQTTLNQQAAQSGPLPALQLITSTTETVILSPENLTVALQAIFDPDLTNEQTVFHLFASGYVKTTNTSSITLKLYDGSSTTVGSDTLLSSSGAISYASTTASWRVIAELQYDSVSGTLVGTAEWYLNKTLVAKATFSNFPTGISYSQTAGIPFLLSITSSAASAGNPTTINVQKFSVG